MGIFGFGSNSSVNSALRDMIASLLSSVSAMGPMGFASPLGSPFGNPFVGSGNSLKDVLLDPKEGPPAAAYIFGFFDYLGQAEGLSEDEITETAKAALKKGLGLTSGQAGNAVQRGIEASRSERGRAVIHDGAMAIADFLEHKKLPFGEAFLKARMFGLE